MIKDQWYLACFLDELKKTDIIKRKIVGEGNCSFQKF
jgi:phenylpropionate dioxygenase-like ring-hydroxylating dioxygenase large terminal subunit